VSFIGYLRPLVQGRATNERPRRRPVAALAAGFTISAFIVTAIVHALGGALTGGIHLSLGVRIVVAAVLLVGFALLDSGKLPIGTPMWRRQTPQRLFYMFGATRGALLWGIDTGLMFTTFRVTSLTWVTFTLAFLGLLPWWAGIAYAAGFVVPAAILILLVPARTDTAPGMEVHWVMGRVSDFGAWVVRLAPFLFVGIAAGLAAVA
jgi:hypothetical protein